MTLYKLNKIISIFLNAVIIILIIYFVYRTDSDKSPIIFMVLYPVLFTLNLLILFVLGLAKSKYSKIYKQIVLGLLILFFPLLIIISSF